MYENFLKTSLNQHRIVTIMYVKGSDVTQRNIKVLKINDNDIEAYCYLRQNIRHFRKDNILAVQYTQ
jgi:predicted DNA-binding transcriptional regulator YafY